MSKTTEYQILRAESADELEAEVSEHIKAGWEPIGGVAVAQANEDYSAVFVQAIVRQPSLMPQPLVRS